MSTTECSCRLWPSPGMYVVTSIPFVSRTRATFRSAELGFFGVVVYTRTHTPRFCGHALSAGAAVFHLGARRPRRISWLIVGIRPFSERGSSLLACCILSTARSPLFLFLADGHGRFLRQADGWRPRHVRILDDHLEAPVGREARAGGDEATHDHVLLEPPQL